MSSAPRRGRVIVGPFVAVTALVATAWLIAGVLLLVIGPPQLAPVGVATLLVGAGLGVMAARMVVLVADETVAVVGQRPLPRADLASVGVRRTSRVLPLYVPVVTVQQGRAVTGVDLDGLSSIGARGAQRAAERLATLLEVPLVAEEALTTAAGPRRGWDG